MRGEISKDPCPKNRKGKQDWAAKYHIGLAPVYYFSYLLGEMFASAIQESISKTCGTTDLNTPSGPIPAEKALRARQPDELVELVKHRDREASHADAWVKEFC